MSARRQSHLFRVAFSSFLPPFSLIFCDFSAKTPSRFHLFVIFVAERGSKCSPLCQNQHLRRGNVFREKKHDYNHKKYRKTCHSEIYS